MPDARLPPSASDNTARPISSLQNERIKLVRSLDMRKARKETGLFVAEGTSILVTAREHGWVPRILAYRAGAADSGIARELVRASLAAGTQVLEVTEAVLAKISAKDNPQSLIAVFEQRWSEPPDPGAVGDSDTWLALEDVRDPGNLGTIVRTVEAVGAAGLILVGACCDPYQRECVRATMGSIFSVPLVRMTRETFLDWGQAWRGEVVGTHLAGRQDVRKVDWRHPVLLLMGSEGPGLSEPLAATCSRLVRIPMAGSLDSLNLSVATALTLYEIRRDQLSV